MKRTLVATLVAIMIFAFGANSAMSAEAKGSIIDQNNKPLSFTYNVSIAVWGGNPWTYHSAELKNSQMDFSFTGLAPGWYARYVYPVKSGAFPILYDCFEIKDDSSVVDIGTKIFLPNFIWKPGTLKVRPNIARLPDGSIELWIEGTIQVNEPGCRDRRFKIVPGADVAYPEIYNSGAVVYANWTMIRNSVNSITISPRNVCGGDPATGFIKVGPVKLLYPPGTTGRELYPTIEVQDLDFYSNTGWEKNLIPRTGLGPISFPAPK
jgi:hypothetical protein